MSFYNVVLGYFQNDDRLKEWLLCNKSEWIESNQLQLLFAKEDMNKVLLNSGWENWDVQAWFRNIKIQSLVEEENSSWFAFKWIKCIYKVL